jgi:hypothetical protein
MHLNVTMAVYVRFVEFAVECGMFGKDPHFFAEIQEGLVNESRGNMIY